MSCEAVGVLLLDHNEAMLMLLLSSRETVLSKAKQTGGPLSWAVDGWRRRRRSRFRVDQ
jgi:hypothetical protein